MSVGCGLAAVDCGAGAPEGRRAGRARSGDLGKLREGAAAVPPWVGPDAPVAGFDEPGGGYGWEP